MGKELEKFTADQYMTRWTLTRSGERRQRSDSDVYDSISVSTSKFVDAFLIRAIY